jgi:hypothetical protein
MIRWEYQIIPIGDPTDPEVNFGENQLLMNGLGGAGWELIAIYQNNMVFKKPLDYAEQ